MVIMGVSWEVLAFIMKSIGARDQQQLAFVVLGQLLFLLAPLCTFCESMEESLQVELELILGN